MNVYLIWDTSRKEHGETATLIDVFFSKEDADKHLREIDWEMVMVEPHEVKGSLSEIAVMELISYTLAGTRGGMRRVIGDSTPEQYDKADQMAEAIANGVRRALHKLGYTKEEAGEQEAQSA